MLRTIITIFALILLVGCGKDNKSDCKHAGSFEKANIEGPHWSNEANTTLNDFIPYHREWVDVFFADRPDGAHVLGTVPMLGYVDVIMEKGTWSHGLKHEWKGFYTRSGVTWEFRISVDVYSTIFFTISDGKSEGKSNLIMWKLDVLVDEDYPVGNG